MKQSFTVRHGALDGVEAFLSVARHRSFRRAADELGVTTSAVSQAIRALEARTGVPLFIRTTRSVGLTEVNVRAGGGVLGGSAVQAAVELRWSSGQAAKGELNRLQPETREDR